MEVDPSSRIAQAQSAAAKAEREAAERVTVAQKRVREAGREEEVQLEHLRDQYAKRTDAERGRGENYLEAVRNRNYQTIAESRRLAENEQHRVVTTGEKDVKDTSRRYADAKYAATHRGEAELKEAVTQNYKQQELERANAKDQLETLKNNFAIEKQEIEATRRDTTTTLAKSSQEQRKAMEEKTHVAVEESNEHYQAAYEGAMKQNRDAMMDLNWRASRGVEEIRRETAQKLDAYSDQKSDPFYRLVNVNGKVTENDDQFVFTAKIPTHEQDRINLNIRGTDLVISGKRKSEEALEVEPGRVQRTNSYQSFSESFPLGYPVDGKLMTREFDGDTLIVRIPKRSTYEAAKPKKTAERAVLERPQFPKNLPGEKELVKLNDPERGPDPQTDLTPPSKRKHTGKTLA